MKSDNAPRSTFQAVTDSKRRTLVARSRLSNYTVDYLYTMEAFLRLDLYLFRFTYCN